MIDYEQLYYDSQYKIKQLEKRIEELESNLNYVKKKDKNDLKLRKEIMEELNRYKGKKYDVIGKNGKEEII